MDISHLKTFLEVSRTRHFGKAANSLYITQSAVSARIRMLEESLGIKLLTRDRNNIQLTPAGIRFLPLAEQIVNTWAIARQTTALEDENKTLLAIAAAHSLWDAGLHHDINQFFQTHENIALNLEAHNQEQLFRTLMDDMVDLCFMYEQPQLSELVAQPVNQLELVLVSSYSKLTANELLAQPDYIYVDWGTAFASSYAKLFQGQRAPNLRVSLARLALCTIKESGGSAYLAKTMIKDELQQKTLFIVDDAPVINREYYIVYKKSSQKQEIIQQLMRQIAKKR